MLENASLVNKEKIKDLVKKYEDVLGGDREDEFNEEDVKSKFLNPLLEALGWDVRGLDEVKFEQTTLTGRTDFGLRLSKGENPVLFVEAKSFSESLDGYRIKRGEKITYPQQVIDDAWQMKVDWAVLTNFKELRLYYTHVRTPADGLQFEIKASDFITEEVLEKLGSLSKEAVASGSLERLEKRRTREDINTEFVNNLYTIRKNLAGDVNERNDLTKEEVRESIQRILDRLVVVRVAEDRDVIHSDSLHEMVEAWEKTSIDQSVRTLMKDLKNLFRDFDSVYNSELFASHICEDLNIQNEILEKIIGTLYDYNFDLIDADVLGAIYEDYIGYVLEEKEDGLDIKPNEDRKTKEGIYYTPTFVVDYIIGNSLSEVLREASLEEVGEIDVLDPACGSGSFLIKAFDYLEDWYTGWNEEVHEKAKKRGRIGDYASMIPNLRRKILEENLYAVDKDEQAAEIASVNLMLKGLKKGERLPLILGDNVKVGNSVLSPKPDIPPELKAFDWVSNFPNQSFDFVIGNPPYIRVDDLPQSDYYKEEHEELLTGKWDIYLLFIRKALELLREGGTLAYIVSNKFLLLNHGEPLRYHLLKNTSIRRIIDLSGVDVFYGSIPPSCILIVDKKEPSEDHTIKIDVKTKKDIPQGLREEIKDLSTRDRIERSVKFLLRNLDFYDVTQSRFLDDPNYLMTITIPDSLVPLMEKIKKDTISLGDLCGGEISEGDTTRKEEGKVVSTQEYRNLSYAEQRDYQKVIRGRNIERFHIAEPSDYIKTLRDTEDICRPRIVIKDISNRPKTAYEDGSCRCLRTIYCAYPLSKNLDEIKYILALLNSNLIRFYYLSNFYCSQMSPREGNFRFREQFVSRLPIKNPDSIGDREKYQLITLANNISDLKDQESWIVSSFDTVIKNFNLTREEPLSYFLDSKIGPKYGIKLTESEKMDAEKRGVPKEYGVKMEDQKVLVMVRTTKKLNFERGLTLSFSDSVLRDYFYLSLKRCEGKKTYRTEKNVLGTLLADMTIPQYEDSRLIDENVAQVRALMDTLSKEHKKGAIEHWKSSSIQELDLAEIEEKIGKVDQSINEKVYDLYGLDNEEIEFAESYIDEFS